MSRLRYVIEVDGQTYSQPAHRKGPACLEETLQWALRSEERRAHLVTLQVNTAGDEEVVRNVVIEVLQG